MAILCGTKASTMISEVPIGNAHTGSIINYCDLVANRTPLFREDGGPHVDVHVSC